MVLNNLYQCGVCANSCLSVIPLLQLHQALIEKLYNVLNIFVNSGGFPKFACRHCLDKIETFNSLITELLKGQDFYIVKEKMLHDLGNNAETNIDETHSIDCDCDICSDKCGLQLLADAIEQKESEQVNEFRNPLANSRISIASEPSTSTSRASTSTHKPKQLQCNYCSKMFSHRGDMNKHLRTHTGEQPFSCHICQRRFKHTSNLKRHLTVHSGDKPFTCDLCGKRFNRKDKLESHRRTRLCRKHSSQDTVLL